VRRALFGQLSMAKCFSANFEGISLPIIGKFGQFCEKY